MGDFGSTLSQGLGNVVGVLAALESLRRPGGISDYFANRLTAQTDPDIRAGFVDHPFMAGIYGVGGSPVPIARDMPGGGPGQMAVPSQPDPVRTFMPDLPPLGEVARWKGPNAEADYLYRLSQIGLNQKLATGDDFANLIGQGGPGGLRFSGFTVDDRGRKRATFSFPEPFIAPKGATSGGKPLPPEIAGGRMVVNQQSAVDTANAGKIPQIERILSRLYQMRAPVLDATGKPVLDATGKPITPLSSLSQSGGGAIDEMMSPETIRTLSSYNLPFFKEAGQGGQSGALSLKNARTRLIARAGEAGPAGAYGRGLQALDSIVGDVLVPLRKYAGDSGNAAFQEQVLSLEKQLPSIEFDNEATATVKYETVIRGLVDTWNRYVAPQGGQPLDLEAIMRGDMPAVGEPGAAAPGAPVAMTEPTATDTINLGNGFSVRARPGATAAR